MRVISEHKKNNTSIAIVYDWLDSWGGVERVLLDLHELFPKADWFTSYYDHKKAQWFEESVLASGNTLTTSFIQKLPKWIKKSRIASLFLYPFAFESFDFSQYDIVLSISSSFAKGVITKPGTKHICILLTPTRFLWSHQSQYQTPSLLSWVRKIVISTLKKWDLIASQRPDKILSISKTVAKRCKKYYGIDSEVVYPPFDSSYWIKLTQNKDYQNAFTKQFSKPISNYFLVVSRLEVYKNIELVIETFTEIPESNLIIVGDGREKKHLQSIAGKNVLFVSNITDLELAWYYSNAQALIMPQEEDFGYVALEAQACGCPVIAYKKGGALETVKNGLFFQNQSTKSLLSCLTKIIYTSVNFNKSYPTFLKENFDKYSFKKTLLNVGTCVKQS